MSIELPTILCDGMKFVFFKVRGHVKGWINHTYDVDMAIGRDVTEISTYKYCTPEVSNCREARGAQTRLVVLEYGMYEGHPVTKLLLIPKTGNIVM